MTGEASAMSDVSKTTEVRAPRPICFCGKVISFAQIPACDECRVATGMGPVRTAADQAYLEWKAKQDGK
jgi:hypothetical protein